ncbi:hypothetical protein HGM15179_013162 [Zosterops borbonicus]|uniref:Rna-directed dna polymerase from mobile element jockey-like n=1 Tax=Zosterops borbonicus TaxID=364589 RepID=A0A8K1G8I5_9PASS|nr:hypothetical protein HGM15179_013162 [Zosterops borbonicus]
MDEGRAVDIFYLNLSKAFKAVLLNITGKLRKCGVGEWTERGRGPLSKFPDNTKLGAVADTSECCAALQKDPDRLERWAEKNHLKFNKANCRVLHLGRKNLMDQYGLGTYVLENSSVGKDLGVLVDLVLSQQCVLVARNDKGVLGFKEKHCQQAGEGHPVALLSPGEGTSGELCPILGSSVQEHLSYKDRPRDLGLFSLEKRQLRGNPINVYQCL